MKKMMTMVSALMMAATSMNAMTDPLLLEEPIKTEAFTEAVVNVPARVRILKGDDYSVNVRSTDKQVTESIKCVVENGILKFYSVNPEGLIGEEIVITVTAPSVPKVKPGENFETVRTITKK